MRIQLTEQRGACRRGEDGAAAVLIAVMTVVLVGILAFVTDFGMAYANVRTLQNGVDAAALAAAQEVLESSSGPGTCNDMVAAAPGAGSIATDAFASNAGADADLVGGIAVTCSDVVLPGQVVVTATGAQTSPGFFGAVFGADDFDLTASAKAVVGPAASIVGLRPFAICESVADLRHSVPGTVVTLDFDNADAGCGTASGNFGLLDIAGGGGSPGTPVVRGWIEDGYGDPVPAVPPFVFEGRTGTPSTSYSDQFAAILDEPIVVPVYDTRTGHGSGSTYNITGFVGVEVCAVKLDPSSLLAGACMESNAITADSHKRFVQLRFVEFIPVGNLNTTCPINATCDPGLRVVKLAD